MKLTQETIARVKACKGVYTLSDTARHFRISKSTVSDVWNGVRHLTTPPALEPPNVQTSRVPPTVIREDGALLLQRGLSPNEVAQQLNISRSTLYYHIGGSQGVTVYV